MSELKIRYQVGNTVLAHECPHCSLIKNKTICEPCGGYGFILTQDGLDLLALVREVFSKGWK